MSAQVRPVTRPVPAIPMEGSYRQIRLFLQMVAAFKRFTAPKK
jgi:hypothetical protein